MESTFRWTEVKSWHFSRRPGNRVQLGAPTPPGQQAIRRQGWGWGVCVCVCLFGWGGGLDEVCALGHTQQRWQRRHSAVTHDNLSTCHASTSRHDGWTGRAGPCLTCADVEICRAHYFWVLWKEKSTFRFEFTCLRRLFNNKLCWTLSPGSTKLLLDARV